MCMLIVKMMRRGVIAVVVVVEGVAWQKGSITERFSSLEMAKAKQ